MKIREKGKKNRRKEIKRKEAKRGGMKGAKKK